MILTNTAIDALRPGQELRDDRVPGLTLRGHTDRKTWSLLYRTRAGERRRYKIGTYPILSLAQAREEAKLRLAEVAMGRDPGGELAGDRRAPTLDDLWLRVKRDYYNADRPWHHQAELIYLKHIGPVLGRKRVPDLDYDRVDALHQRLKDLPTQANRVISVLSKMLNLAERWKLRPLGSNPCQQIVRFKETPRRRYASAEEIVAIGKALEAEAAANPSGVALIYLLMFSGARPSEILRAAPQQVEPAADGSGVLRIDDGKTGRRDVYLPPQAMAVLARLPADRKLLADRATMPKALWSRVCAAAGIEGLWARDWRRTFASVALANGLSSAMLGELLGHRSAQTTKIYARLMEEPALKASAATAARLEQLLRPSASVSAEPNPTSAGIPAPPSPDR